MFPNAPFVFNALGSGGGGAAPVLLAVHGTTAAPVLLDGSTALVVTTPTALTTELNFIASSGGALIMSANPQIDASTEVGKTIIMTGISDVDTITFVPTSTLRINGNWTARSGSMISVYWDGSAYREASRNDI
jgi:hypothetical protein